MDVPQGFSIGSLFFLIYVNYLNKAADCISSLFVDDTYLIVKAPRPIILQNKIYKELLNLSPWCCANKLTINPDKSQVVIFPPKQDM